MARLFEKVSSSMGTNWSSIVQSESLVLVAERWENRMEVRQMTENAVIQMIHKLDARVAEVTGDSLIGMMENIDDDHNTALVRGSLMRATYSVLTSMLKDEGV